MFLTTTFIYLFPEALPKIKINTNGAETRIASKETTIVKMTFYEKF